MQEEVAKNQMTKRFEIFERNIQHVAGCIVGDKNKFLRFGIFEWWKIQDGGLFKSSKIEI